MPVFLALLGGGAIGAVLGFIFGQRKTTQELTGWNLDPSEQSPTGEADPGGAVQPKTAGDPAYSPISSASFNPASSTGSAMGNLAWWQEQKPPYSVPVE